MQEVSRLISIKQLTTTPYNPKCNGLVERFNGTLKSILKKLCADRPEDWDRYLPAVLFAYREVPQDSTGFSPFELLYGRQVRGPMTILKEIWLKEDTDDESEVQTTYDYVVNLRNRIESTCELARVELSKASARYKKYYDRKTKSRVLKPGDLALILLPTDTNKLLVQWKGPFKVLRRVNKCDYSLEVKGKAKTFHINLLKEFVQRSDISEEVGEVEDQDNTEMVSTMVINDEEDVIESLNTASKGETIADVTISDSLTMLQENHVREVLNDFGKLFTDKPGTTNLEEHCIRLTTPHVVKQKAYPIPYSMRSVVQKEIDAMLELDVIERTNSPYASPIVIVKKKDNTNRFCVDFRKLNCLTVFDGEPMPSVIDIFSNLKHDKYFTKIDLSKGFWQIPVREEDKEKTAFVTTEGKYQFKKMPFGLVNATASFCRLMRKVLNPISNVDSFVDDILIHTRTWDDHIETLESVLYALHKAGLTIRPTKCFVGFRSVEFLGHDIGHGYCSPVGDKIQQIMEAEIPTTKKKVRSFLGSIGFYRSYIPNFSTIAEPLTNLTKKDRPNVVRWTEEHGKAFEVLKKCMSEKPILKMPDCDKCFYLQTDASDVGVGAVLLQDHDGTRHPVAYFSRKLNTAERNYSVIEKECLAIVKAIEKFEIFLYGCEFILETDHKALEYIDQTRSKNARVMRWALLLQNYRFSINSIKGSDNVLADFLSRSAVKEGDLELH